MYVDAISVILDQNKTNGKNLTQMNNVDRHYGNAVIGRRKQYHKLSGSFHS